MSKLAEKVAVVTGASKGIGAAIAKALAAEGAAVVVNYANSRTAADAVVAAITASGGKAVAVKADVSNAVEAADLVEAAVGHFGRIDILVRRLDLAATPIGHLTAAHLGAAQGAPVDEALKADVAIGNVALEEFLAADVVVVGAPMYNFTVSSQLKAWIDRIAVAGKTFRYGEQGPIGLCGDKKLIIASSRGGAYIEGSTAAFLDHQETYLSGLFGFLGITDITFIRAEGVAMGPEARSGAVASAKTEIATLAA